MFVYLKAFFLAAVVGAAFMFSAGPDSGECGEECPDVVLITMESVRPDRMPCYGYERNTTPQICSIADRGYVYENAYTPSTLTETVLPAISLGMYPNEAGIYSGDISIVRTEHTTLAEALNRKGYSTYYLQAGQRFLPEKRNATQGFDRFVASDNPVNAFRETYVRNFSENNDGPHFVRIHLSGATRPYAPRADYRKNNDLRYIDEVDKDLLNYYASDEGRESDDPPEYIRDAWDEKLKSIDSAVMRPLIGDLKRKGLYNDSIVVFTADHGEALGEKKISGEKFGHNDVFVREVFRVPLIVKMPGKGEKHVNKTVSTIDIYPTLLDQLDIPIPEKVSGKNLFESDDRFVFANHVVDVVMRKDKIMVKRGDSIRTNFDTKQNSVLYEGMRGKVGNFSRRDVSEITVKEKLGDCKEVEPYFTC